MRMSVLTVIGILALAVLLAVSLITGNPAPIIIGIGCAGAVATITASLKDRSRR